MIVRIEITLGANLRRGEDLVNEQPDELDFLVDADVGHEQEDHVVSPEKRHQHQRRLGPAPVHT